MRAIWIAVVILLVIAGVWYFGGYRYTPRQVEVPRPPNENMAQNPPQPGPPLQPGGAQESQPPAGENMAQNRPAPAGPGAAGTATAPAPPAGEDWTGRTVLSSGGQVLGVVDDLRRGSQGDATYVIVKGDQDRLYPVPADLLSRNPQGDQLTAAFDENTFQNAPSFSSAEEQQISQAQLDQVRGYYQGTAAGGRRQSGAIAPRDRGVMGRPGTPVEQPIRSQ